MHKDNGAEIETVRPDSRAQHAGITPGDIILSVNGHRVHDNIDFMFFKNDGHDLNLHIRKKDKRFNLTLPAEKGQDTGIEIKSPKIKTCTNKCIFCFVNQLPKGLRRTLYIKDEDYRLSFLYGSYITLTNLSPQEKERIVTQRLSPIYISVHTTNPELRKLMLGNSKAGDVMKELSFFKENRIKMHCQIVLCPKFNDGKELQRTLRDLYKFYPFVASIAVVPVGLTAHRKTAARLRPFEKTDAAMALEIIKPFQKRFLKKHGDALVYGADELYIKAEADFPQLSEYGELPQLENGVGLVPSFLHQARKIKIPQIAAKGRFITFTGLSFYPYLAKFIERLRKNNIDIEVLPIENTFFGKSVTVTGLLTGRDILKKLSDIIKKDDTLLIPDIVMRDGDGILLDDISQQDFDEVLGIKSLVIPSTPKGIINAVTSQPKGKKADNSTLL